MNTGGDMDYWTWVELYKPIQNIFDKTAGIDGCLFLPYGEQWDFIKKHESRYLWTLIITDLDKETLWEISSGIHVVNQQGYLVAEVPYAEDINITY